MNLGKKFEIKTKIGENHTISLNEIEPVYKDKNNKIDPKKRLSANIAIMKETYVNSKGDTVSHNSYVYFEVPYLEGSGGLALIPKLLETYEKNRRHMPRKYQYNYIGSMYYDDLKDALVYSKVCGNKEARKIIADLNKKLRRFKVKDKSQLERPTLLEKMAEKFNNSGEEIEETKEKMQDIGNESIATTEDVITEEKIDDDKEL